MMDSTGSCRCDRGGDKSGVRAVIMFRENMAIVFTEDIAVVMSSEAMWG